MYTRVSAFFALTVFGVASGAIIQGSWDVDGFYWRDYTGDISVDALQGGTDVIGKPIYIGQVFERFLIPAKIYSTEKKAYYEYNDPLYSTSRAIRLRTNNDDIKLIRRNQHLVIGGFEPGCTTYIGRVRSGGEILVGKAIADTLPWNGLHVTKDGSGIYHTTFEVLAFNSSLPKNNLCKKFE